MDRTPSTGQGSPLLVSAIRPIGDYSDTSVSTAQGRPVPIDLTNRFVGRTFTPEELRREGARYEQGRWLVKHDAEDWELSPD